METENRSIESLHTVCGECGPNIGLEELRQFFTWDDVRLLRYETPGVDMAVPGAAERRSRFLDLADRIAFLLPPRA
jgi:hypothetical protein